ncbi:MAG TPA: GntR family transcriptional regulator [Gammaproteobacteria bacterium]|nr:GntR family transcriptional regulator [Gammaproteobacteria bacterium]
MGSPQVGVWVRERIRQGRLVPGQRLVEADIVAATGASRSRVREALRRLEAEGLVTIEEFRGASVKRLGPDEVRQIYEARMALEGLAAAECARRADAALRERLQQIQSELNAGEHAGDHDRFARLNEAWHGSIIIGSGNQYVAQFLTRLTVPIYRLVFATFYTAERIAAANADHRVITAAIVEGRADAAERAMRAHIRNGLDALLELDTHFDA